MLHRKGLVRSSATFSTASTRTGHRRPKFAVMHNTAPMNGVVGCDPRAEGPYETTRVHHAPRRRGGGVAARGARAAAGEAADHRIFGPEHAFGRKRVGRRFYTATA